MTNIDSSELTPPNGTILLQTDASQDQIVGAINRHGAILVKTFDAVQVIHRGLISKGMCPRPGEKCAALNMAGTAELGVAELHGLRRRDNRWMLFVGIVVGGLTTFSGAWLSSNTTAAAAAVAAKVAVDAARDEVRKAQKSTEETAFAAGRDGAKLGAREAIEALGPRPLVVTK